MRMAFEVLDEHEQGELVRKWLRANAVSIAIGIAIGLLLIFGWQQWKARELRNQAEAAMQYRAFADALEVKSFDDAAKIAEALRANAGKTPYAAFAALRQAEVAVGKGELEAAAADLEFASEASRDPALKALAHLRAARVSLARGDADGALKQLDRLNKTDYAGLAAELRGDALVKLGRVDDARAAYTQALSALDERLPGRTFVQMKLNDLGPTAEKTNS
jgi:predicted negative regulator of RcsB-dependent stress response